MYPPEEPTESRYSFSPESKPFNTESEKEEWTPIEYCCPFCNGENGEHKTDCPTNTHGAGW